MDIAELSTDAPRGAVEAGPFGMPKPQGWTIERLVMILAGSLVLLAQLLQPRAPRLLRLFSAWVGINLTWNGAAGFCPASIAMHRLGIPTAAEHNGRR